MHQTTGATLSKNTPIQIQREKSCSLFDAIADLDEVINKARRLSDRINGVQDTPSNAIVSPPRCYPSLATVLSTGAGELKKKHEVLYELLNEISAALF